MDIRGVKMKKTLLILLSSVFALTACNEEVKVDETPEKDAKILVYDHHSEWANFVAKSFTEKTGIPVEVKTPEKEWKGDVFLMDGRNAEIMKKKERILENKEFPLGATTYTIYYNKNLVEKEPESFDEIMLQAKEFTNRKERKYGILVDPNNSMAVASLLNKQGEEFVKGLKETFPTRLEDISQNMLEEEFAKGNVLYIVDGAEKTEYYKNKGMDVGIITLPHPYVNVESYYVNKNTEFPNASLEFATFASSDDMQKKRFEMTGVHPYKKGETSITMTEKEMKNDLFEAWNQE